MNQYLIVLAVLSGFFLAESLLAQTTSRGPGKGPATPGTGSKYTYPQPTKTKVAIESYIPESQIPEFPDRFRWKLVAKNFNPASTSKKIPVYAFNDTNGKRSIVGEAREGEEITLEEVRQSSKRNFYKYKGSVATSSNGKSGTQPDYWIDGMHVEFAGKK